MARAASSWAVLALATASLGCANGPSGVCPKASDKLTSCNGPRELQAQWDPADCGGFSDGCAQCIVDTPCADLLNHACDSQCRVL